MKLPTHGMRQMSPFAETDWWKTYLRYWGTWVVKKVNSQMLPVLAMMKAITGREVSIDRKGMSDRRIGERTLWQPS